MKPDIPIIGQPSPTSEALSNLGPFLMFKEADEVLKNTIALEGIMRVHELRKSAGIIDATQTTINIRRPPRYSK